MVEDWLEECYRGVGFQRAPSILLPSESVGIGIFETAWSESEPESESHKNHRKRNSDLFKIRQHSRNRNFMNRVVGTEIGIGTAQKGRNRRNRNSDLALDVIELGHYFGTACKFIPLTFKVKIWFQNNRYKYKQKAKDDERARKQHLKQKLATQENTRRSSSSSSGAGTSTSSSR